MDIGSKLRQARQDAGLTQEQAAEALHVSRQTISNWENEKTYPDILNVIAMSDLYTISLDLLLKGESPVPGYVSYLAESTDVVRSRKRFSLFLVAAVYLAIWAFAILVYWLFTSPSDAMGYAFLFLLLLLPITTLVLSFFAGSLMERRRWLAVILFGLFYMLAEYATFSASHMMSQKVLDLPSLTYLLTGAALSALGVTLGAWMGRRQRKRMEKQDM